MYNSGRRGKRASDSQSYTVGINRPIIGTDGNSPNTNSFTGYISDLRVTKGYARYTSNNTTYLNGPYSLK